MKNVYWSSYKVSLFLSDFNETLFSQQTLKNTQNIKFPVGAELFLADGHT
jgi:hypothetical protein